MSDPLDLALKEWAVTVLALASGQTIAVVRKGGIHEKRFAVPGWAFLLFPTYLHQAPETLQPRFHALLQAALAKAPAPGELQLRYRADVTDIVPLAAPDHLEALAPHVVWTPAYVEQRFRWRPRQPLQLLLLRVRRLPEMVTVPLLPAYNGCSSWVQLDRAVATGGGQSALSDADYAKARSAILEAVHEVAGA